MKTIERFGHVFHQENWKELLELADSLYESRGDGWDSFIEQEMEKYCICHNTVGKACEVCGRDAVEIYDDCAVCQNCKNKLYFGEM